MYKQPPSPNTDHSNLYRMTPTNHPPIPPQHPPQHSNPYRVTLRKLWAKMAEKDWRTVAKALYIFHVLLRCALLFVCVCVYVCVYIIYVYYMCVSLWVCFVVYKYIIFIFILCLRGCVLSCSKHHTNNHTNKYTHFHRECEPDDVRIYKKASSKQNTHQTTG